MDRCLNSTVPNHYRHTADNLVSELSFDLPTLTDNFPSLHPENGLHRDSTVSERNPFESQVMAFRDDVNSSSVVRPDVMSTIVKAKR
jgi:hypothetical protein